MNQMFGIFIILAGVIFSAQASASEPRHAAAPFQVAAVDPIVTNSIAQAAPGSFDPKYEPQIVNVTTPHAPGTVIIDTDRKFLYLVQENGTAIRYGVGVGRAGFEWTGTERITRKAEWPGWTPPAEMRRREPNLPAFMPGGPDNPLGARALYLGNTLYRLHGTSNPATIGRNISSGCIRLRNQDIVDLYERVPVGATVIVF
jgi:lipoprotein-anchoring transpeptidase ErfK/SrfK